MLSVMSEITFNYSGIGLVGETYELLDSEELMEVKRTVAQVIVHAENSKCATTRAGVGLLKKNRIVPQTFSNYPVCFGLYHGA